MPLQREVVIRDLGSGDETAAIDLLAEAFLEFPAMHVLVGRDDGARDRLRRLYAMEFEPGSGTRAIGAEVGGRLVGALTYMDSPACGTASAGRTARFLRIAGPRILRTMRMFGRIERAHPQAPHRHLPTVGVLPELQSQGIGARLMQVFDERCDADAASAYLETIRWADPTKASHERFYGRLGYMVSRVIPMTDEWSVLTMTRPPAAPLAG